MSSTLVGMTNTRDVLEDSRLRTVALAGRELFTTVNAGVLGRCNRLDRGGGVGQCLSLGSGFMRRSQEYIMKGDIMTTYISW